MSAYLGNDVTDEQLNEAFSERKPMTCGHILGDWKCQRGCPQINWPTNVITGTPAELIAKLREASGETETLENEPYHEGVEVELFETTIYQGTRINISVGTFASGRECIKALWTDYGVKFDECYDDNATLLTDRNANVGHVKPYRGTSYHWAPVVKVGKKCLNCSNIVTTHIVMCDACESSMSEF